MNSNQYLKSPSLNLGTVLSLVIAVLMAGISLAGLLFQNVIYPVEELRRSFVPNDVVNLAIGLPILLLSLWLTRRGKLTGLLFWPGALYYITYNYIAYAFATAFTIPFFIYLALVILSVFAILRLFAAMDAQVIQTRLKGAFSERFAAGVLVGLGVLFFVRAGATIVGAITSGMLPAIPDLAVQIADVCTTPAWIIGGILLWQRKAWGYASGLGLLFQASMLFIALLVFMLLQPVLTTAPFVLTDFVVILVMGLVCFIPFGLFLRAVIVRSN